MMGKFCVKCGAPLSATAKFCAACGNSVDGEKERISMVTIQNTVQVPKRKEPQVFKYTGSTCYYGLMAQRRTKMTLTGTQLDVQQKIPILFFTGGKKHFSLDVRQLVRVHNEKSLDKLMLVVMIGVFVGLLIGGASVAAGAALLLAYGIFKKELCFYLADGSSVRMKGVSGRNDLSSLLSALREINPSLQIDA